MSQPKVQTDADRSPAESAKPTSENQDIEIDARRQRVLDSKTPNQVVAERLNAEPKLANPIPHGRAGPCDVTKAHLIIDAAKEVSQPNSSYASSPAP